MKLPIIAYGHPILRQQCKNIDKNFPKLEQLIADMWESMFNANGCGLAAPQIGQAINLFIVDSKSTYDSLDKADRKTNFDQYDRGIMETFINARIIQRSEKSWEDKEGCLSIPGLSQSVKRNWEISIEYFDKDFKPQTRTFSGITARMIQHEFDHSRGILFIDHLNPLIKKLVMPKLKKIRNGQLPPNYPMKFV